MAAPQYPRRESHFAHKLVRLMLHSCAAQEIGADGFLLVCAIAHTEDAKRYTGPVTFWNEQLIPILGMGSWGQLDRARKKAVEHGWLHYEAGGKGKAGKYWAVIPRAVANVPDVSTEADYDVDVMRSKNGEDNVKETWENRGTTGEHSTLSLSLFRTELNCTELARVDAAEPSDSRPVVRDGGRVVEPLPLRDMYPSSVYRRLTEKHLASARSMVEWFRRQLSASSPVLRGTREDLVLCLCCSGRARERGVKNQVGKFATLVQSRRWAEVERFRAEAEAAVDGPLAEAVGWCVSPETKGGA